MLDTKMLDTQEVVLNNRLNAIDNKTTVQNSATFLLALTGVLTLAVCLQTMSLLQGPVPLLVVFTLGVTALSYFYSLRASMLALLAICMGFVLLSQTTFQTLNLNNGFFSTQILLTLGCVSLAAYNRILKAGIRFQEKLQHFANTHDDLTLLLNRETFVEKLDEIIKASPPSQERFALVLIDIKGLNDINKQHGFKAGNAALSILSDRLKQVAHKGDLVARIEDGCFALVIRKMAHNAQLSGYISRVNAILNLPFNYAWTEINLDTRIASSFYPLDGKTATELLELNIEKLS